MKLNWKSYGVRWIGLLSCILALSGTGCAAPAGSTPGMVVREDFEGAAPRLPVFWGYNVDLAQTKVNFAGLSSEQAFGGQHSFKLDVTLTGGSYYYYALPVKVPFWSPLKFSGRLRVEPVKSGNAASIVQLGYGWALPSLGQIGNVVHGHKVGEDKNGWEEWVADTAAFVGGSETAYLHALAIYILAPPGGFKNTRVTLYVDDFELKGDLPQDYEAQLDYKIKTIDEQRQREAAQSSLRLQQRTSSVLAQIRPAFGRNLPVWAASLQNRLAEYVQQRREQVEKDAALLRANPSDAAAAERLKQSLPVLELAARSLNALPAYVARHDGQPYYSSVANPIQDERILPTSFPLAAIPASQMEVEVAPDEYEPVSFVLTALQNLKAVKLQIGPLRRVDGVTVAPIPSVDARLVKVWWQAGISFDDVKHPTLTPELLLHDDTFVAVDPDPQAHRNTLKNARAPRDADTLQPVNIAAGTHQQFWLTVHAPANTLGGVYTTKVTVLPANAAPLEINLRVRVYPFQLQAPMTENAIYYRARLSPDGRPTLSTDLKSEQQYRAELRNMKAHGVTLPTSYTYFLVLPDGSYDFRPLKRVMDIYRQEGLTEGPIVLMSAFPFYDFAGKDEATQKQLLEKVRSMTQALETFRRQNNYPRLAPYGIDEAVGEKLLSQREAFRVINQLGGMVAAAVGPNFFPAVGEWLNRPIIAGGQPEIYPKVHDRGFKVWIYARPMVGVEAPEIYRRNYGLLLWKRGEDGSCPYAYQATENSDLYDELGNSTYRSMSFTYPTIDGVIDTVQWEGHREGIDDVRYLTTLLKEIKTAKQDPKRASSAQSAERWLAQIDIEGDLQTLRGQIANWIMNLQSPQQQQANASFILR